MRRALRAFPFLVAVGCGGAEPRGPDLSTHEGIADALVEVKQDLADALDGIRDKATAEAAKPALQEIAKRENDVWAALEKLGEPGDEEKKRLDARVNATLEKLHARMEAAMERLRADPATGMVVDTMMDEYLAAADPRTYRRHVLTLRLEKQNNLRAILRRLLADLERRTVKLPMKEGVLDVYALARSGEIGRDEYFLFRERRNGVPTDEEIDRGDYTNFPYERYRGSGEVEVTASVPLLWDKKPDADGTVLVGTSAGTAVGMSRDELAKALGK
jgi:hypothetical protein